MANKKEPRRCIDCGRDVNTGRSEPTDTNRCQPCETEQAMQGYRFTRKGGYQPQNGGRR